MEEVDVRAKILKWKDLQYDCLGKSIPDRVISQWEPQGENVPEQYEDQQGNQEWLDRVSEGKSSKREGKK